MNTWQSPQSRPLSIHNLVLGVTIGLAILCAAITLVVVLERQRSEPDLGDAIARLDEARAELVHSTRAMHDATAALHAATRAPTTINIMDPPPPTSAPVMTDDARTTMAAIDAMYTVVDELRPQPLRYCPQPERCVLPRTVLDEALANPASLAKQARIMPSIQDGVPRGFKLYGIRPGSLPRDLGLKNGDLIKSANGLPLHGFDQAMAAYAKLHRSDRVILEIERKGETIRKEISIQ